MQYTSSLACKRGRKEGTTESWSPMECQAGGTVKARRGPDFILTLRSNRTHTKKENFTLIDVWKIA